MGCLPRKQHLTISCERGGPSLRYRVLLVQPVTPMTAFVLVVCDHVVLQNRQWLKTLLSVQHRMHEQCVGST